MLVNVILRLALAGLVGRLGHMCLLAMSDDLVDLGILLVLVAAGCGALAVFDGWQHVSERRAARQAWERELSSERG